MKKNNISRDFTWEEFEYSRIALSKGLDNNPPDEVRPAIRELVQRLLQPLRIAYGGPIYIMSGYRSPKVNHLAGGVPSSQHVKGEAADCYVPDIYKLLEILKKSELPFDQAILYTKKHILHLSLRKQGKNRRQILINQQQNENKIDSYTYSDYFSKYLAGLQNKKANQDRTCHILDSD